MSANLSPQFGGSEYYRQVIAGEHPPAMFATAKELVDTHLLGDQYGGIYRYDKPTMHRFKSKEETLAHKLTAKPELTQSIKEHGYDWSKPATIHAISNTSGVQNKGLINDAHHRIAAMLEHRPDEFLPIETR